MGTRADFYIGRGKSAEWVGSIAYDGYPDGYPGKCVKDKPGYEKPVIEATSEADFRELVASLIAIVGHGTKPEQGWPWPWRDSSTTDYAYAFDGGKVWASCFGGPWFDPVPVAARQAKEPDSESGKGAEFPDMTEVQKVTFCERSGMIVVGG